MPGLELELFGWSLASGEYANDHRFADLAVGIPRDRSPSNYDARNGAVHLFFGAGNLSGDGDVLLNDLLCPGICGLVPQLP